MAQIVWVVCNVTIAAELYLLDKVCDRLSGARPGIFLSVERWERISVVIFFFFFLERCGVTAPGECPQENLIEAILPLRFSLPRCVKLTTTISYYSNRDLLQMMRKAIIL